MTKSKKPLSAKQQGAAKQTIIDLYATGEYTIDQACRQAGVSRATHYNWLASNDVAYVRDMETARAQRIDVLEDEAYRRAKVGTPKPVFHQGVVVGAIKEFSDVLLIFLLKAANPSKYRERFVGDPAGKAQTVEDMLEQIARERGLTVDGQHVDDTDTTKTN